MWCTDKDRIAGIVDGYFKNFFSTSHLNRVDEVLNSVDKVILEEMNQSLLRPFVGEEVRRAFFQMHLSKLPGPDGMSPFSLFSFFSKNIGI